jgi:hypothetical protein
MRPKYVIDLVAISTKIGEAALKTVLCKRLKLTSRPYHALMSSRFGNSQYSYCHMNFKGVRYTGVSEVMVKNLRMKTTH